MPAAKTTRPRSSRGSASPKQKGVGKREAELTPEFPPHIKPLRKGWYQTSFESSHGQRLEGVSYWELGIWSCQFRQQEPTSNFSFLGAEQNKRWRGLASNPKGSKP